MNLPTHIIPSDRSFFNQTEYYVSDLIKCGFGPLLESPYLQRLKNISYLATMNAVYRLKANYTRFDHSVAAAALALNIAERLNFSKEIRNLMVAYYLIHDIGHTAFSHAGEAFLLQAKRMYHTGALLSIIRNNIIAEGYDRSINHYISDLLKIDIKKAAEVLREPDRFSYPFLFTSLA